MTVEFDPGRDRDAWATIRGYVYQVDLTVDRWLELDSGEILELERGEDVDLLGNALAEEGVPRERLLEQVKHLENTVTLRSAPASAFLANAHAHRRENPSLLLRFRFTTTALPGAERATSVARGIQGIVAWEQIRAGAWPPDELADGLSAIRELLASTTAPKDVPEPIWASYQEFVRNAGTAEFAGFIRACEWSTGHVAADGFEARLRVKLTALGLAPDPASAGSLYDRLLTFVFRLLTRRGVKRLTRDALLDQVGLWRQGVPLSREDDRRLRELRDNIRAVEARVGAVESAVGELRMVTAGSAAMIDELARREGIAAAVEHVTRTVALEEPPQVEHASSRSETVSEMVRGWGGATWLALHGVSGIGKSQLALLVARTVAGTRVWIRFRDLSIPQACMRIDVAIAQLAGAPPSGDRGRAESLAGHCRAAVARIGRGGALVLDDLPRYRGGDEFAVRLESLVRAAAEIGVGVLSTGPLPVPTAVVELFPEGRIVSVASPPFTVDEVADVLAANGAPSRWQSQGLATLVYSATGGHPTLVRACARDLARRGWAANLDALGRVLGSDFAAGVNEDTVHALIDSAPDADARELLFRLNLVGGEFTLDVVQLLAAVHPAIPHPRSHLDPLLGLWVQSDAGERYAVSPLVRPLGGAELTPETRRLCHARLAERIVSRPVMDDLEASRAIGHFISAENYDSAGWVLLRGLVALRGMELPVGARPLFAEFWIDLPLPEGMAVGLQLIIRALQIGVRARTDRDFSQPRADLDRLLAELGPADAWAEFTACMFAADSLAVVDMVSAGEYLVHALRLRQDVLAQVHERGLSTPEMPLEQLIWTMVPGLKSPEKLDAWVDLLERMTPDERRVAFEDHGLFREGASIAVNGLMFAEEEKAPDERDWGRVLTSLRSLTQRARAMGLQFLADAAVVTQMNILGEFQRDLAAAEALAVEVLDRPGVDPYSAFQVTNSLGLLLYDYGPKERARLWLEHAFAMRNTEHAWKTIRAGIFLSVLVADGDVGRAAELLAEAARFADEHADSAELARVEAHGERAVAEWLRGDLPAAWRSWDRAATSLFEAEEHSADWKSIFVLFGHISGYLTSVATTGNPPADLGDGEPYAAPARGLFVRRPPGRDGLFSEESLWLLPVQLSLFADAAGTGDSATAWASRAVALCREAGRGQFTGVVLPILIADAVEKEDFDRAFALAREQGVLRRAVELVAPQDVRAPMRSPEELLGPEGGDPWLSVESAAMLTLVPIYLHLELVARRSREDAGSRLPALNAALRKCAATSADPQAWHAAVELFDAIFSLDASDAHLVSHANNYAFRLAETAGRLKVVAYLAASSRSGIPMERSLALQLAAALVVGREVIPQARGFGEVAGEYFGGMWQERFDRGKFRFSHPQEVERGLARAATAGPDRARLVLATVARGLGVSLRPDLRKWLYASEV